jgi:multidrug resistance protein
MLKPSNNSDQAMQNPPSNSWFIFTVLLAGSFITIEAAAFQAPAIPAISKYFDIPASMAALVSMIYYLALVIGHPICGQLADRFGRKRILTIGLSGFIVSEFLAAISTGYEFLLVARFLQGASVACILPIILSYVAYLFPSEKRGMPLGILAFSMSLGATTGAVIGGVLIDAFSWRAVYWVSGALSILGLLLTLWKVPETPTTRSQITVDRAGILLLFFTATALLSAPTMMSRFGLSSTEALSVLGAGIVCAFIMWQVEKRAQSPVVDTGIMSKRNFFIPCLVYMMFLVVHGGTIYSLSFFISDRPGGSASQVGLINTFAFGTSMIAGLISGKVIDKVSEKTVIICIICLMSVGVAMYTQIRLDTSIWVLAGIVSILGFSQGMKGPAITKLTLRSVPASKLGTGSGMFSMMRDFGTPAGVTIGLALYSHIRVERTRESLFELATQHGLGYQFWPALTEALSTKGKQVSPELSEQLTHLGTNFNALLIQAQQSGINATMPNLSVNLLGVLIVMILLAMALPNKINSTK